MLPKLMQPKRHAKPTAALLLEKPREQKNHHSSLLLLDHHRRRRTMEKNSLRNNNNNVITATTTSWLTFPTNDSSNLVSPPPQAVQDHQPSSTTNNISQSEEWTCGVAGLHNNHDDSTWPSSSSTSASTTDDFDLLVTSRQHQTTFMDDTTTDVDMTTPSLDTTFEQVKRYVSQPKVGDTWKAVVAPAVRTARTRDLTSKSLDTSFVECLQLKTKHNNTTEHHQEVVAGKSTTRVTDLLRASSNIMKVSKSAPDWTALAKGEVLDETGAFCSNARRNTAVAKKNHDFKKHNKRSISSNKPVAAVDAVALSSGRSHRTTHLPLPPMPLMPKGKDADKDWKEDGKVEAYGSCAAIGNVDSNEFTKQTLLQSTDSHPASKSNRSHHSGTKVQYCKSAGTLPHPQVSSYMSVSMESEKGAIHGEHSKSHSIPTHHPVKRHGDSSTSSEDKSSHASSSTSETRLEPASKLFKAPPRGDDTALVFPVIDLKEETKKGTAWAAVRKLMNCDTTSRLESKEGIERVNPVHANLVVANHEAGKKDRMLGRDPKVSLLTTGQHSTPASDWESTKSSSKLNVLTGDPHFLSWTAAHRSNVTPSNTDNTSKALDTTDNKTKAKISIEKPRSLSQNNVRKKTKSFRDATANLMEVRRFLGCSKLPEKLFDKDALFIFDSSSTAAAVADSNTTTTTEHGQAVHLSKKETVTSAQENESTKELAQSTESTHRMTHPHLVKALDRTNVRSSMWSSKSQLSQGKYTSDPEAEQSISRLDGEAKFVHSDDSVLAPSSFDMNLLPPTTATGILSKTAEILEARKLKTVAKSTRDSHHSDSSSGEEWEATQNLLVADCFVSEDGSAWDTRECKISSDAAGFLNSQSVSRIGHLDESLNKKDASTVAENTLSTECVVMSDSLEEEKPDPSPGKSKAMLNCHTLIGEPRTAMTMSVPEQSYSIAVEDWSLEDTVDTVDAVAVAESRPINVVQVSHPEISELYESVSIFESIDSQASFRIVPHERARYSSRHGEMKRGTIQRIQPIVSSRGQTKHTCRTLPENLDQAYFGDSSFDDEQERSPPSIICQSLKTCFGGDHGTAGKREHNRQRVLDSLRKKAANGLLQAALACHSPDLQETSFRTASTGQTPLSPKRPAWDSLFDHYLDFVESSFLNERKTERPHHERKPKHIIYDSDTTMVSSAMEVSQWSYLIELNSIAEESPEVEITFDSGTAPVLEATSGEMAHERIVRHPSLLL